MKKYPLVSIIIVNFNGIKWLNNCFTSIEKQTYKNLEVIVVDNNSSDNSVDFIKKKFPKFNIIRNKKNYGFAEGNNIGVNKARGDYFFLLNNDTKLVENDFILKVVSFMKENTKIGIVQPKINFLDFPNKIDLCGSFWTPTTILYHYGCFQDENSPLFNKNFPIFTCKGAAMFVTKECVKNIGLFDRDFWCYYEETDFCHRAWNHGYETWYFSETKILHANGGTSLNFDNDYIQFHNFKNKLRSFIKNFYGFERIIVIIKFTITSIVFTLISLVQGNYKNLLALIKAYIWNFNKLMKTKKNTANIIRGNIPNNVIRKPKFVYYIDLLIDLKRHNYNND